MHYQELAEGVKHFKEEGGKKVMCQAVEKYAMEKAKEMLEEYAKEIAEEYAREAAIKTTIEEGIEYGIDREHILSRVCKKYNLNRKEAEEIYETCLGDV